MVSLEWPRLFVWQSDGATQDCPLRAGLAKGRALTLDRTGAAPTPTYEWTRCCKRAASGHSVWCGTRCWSRSGPSTRGARACRGLTRSRGEQSSSCMASRRPLPPRRRVSPWPTCGARQARASSRARPSSWSRRQLTSVHQLESNREGIGFPTATRPPLARPLGGCWMLDPPNRLRSTFPNDP